VTDRKTPVTDAPGSPNRDYSCFSLDFGSHAVDDSLAFVQVLPQVPLQKVIDTMFGGSETTRVTSSAPEDQVYSQIESGLKDLGSVKVSKAGTITIDPAPNLSSFHSATTVNGQVTKQAGGEYEVKINYDVSPTPVNWIISVVLFCLTGIGVLFFLISLLQKSTDATAIQNALNQLKSKVK
jgi:hypothetical protein